MNDIINAFYYIVLVTTDFQLILTFVYSNNVY